MNNPDAHAFDSGDAVTRTRLAAIVQSSKNAIISKDLDGVILTWNPAAEHIFGYTAAEMIGQSIFRLIPPALHDEERSILERLAVGETIDDYETTRVRKDGTLVTIELSASPIRDGDGKLVGASAVKRDVTQERSLEAQLRQAQKMDAVGQLAGGIAHDFNNLLSVILAYGQMVAEGLPRESPFRESLEEIVKAGTRAAELTGQLLSFSRRQVMDLRVVNLNDVLVDVESMLRRMVGEDVEFDIVLSAEPVRCRADTAHLGQVLMNLAVNARDAMPDGGKLIIEIGTAELDDDYVKTHADARPGPHAMISVTDTGCGMSPETQARIFDPFFTTKPDGRGTGLGLSTVYGIVKQIGGNVWVYSEVGQGTTIKVYLPRTQEPEAALGDHAAPAVHKRGTETILLVEDDDQVRKLVRDLLMRAGYRVLDAARGGEALVISERLAEPIHLLLTDVVMPWMTGRELSDRLLEMRPAMRVIHMSGYAERAIVKHGVLDPGINYLAKPITAPAVLAKVREVLDG